MDICNSRTPLTTLSLKRNKPFSIIACEKDEGWTNEKILIVEDEFDVRANLQDLLESESYEVVTAKDGKEGYNKAVEELPDLIISDIKMPYADGSELYKKLQTNANTNQIPFIFLTAEVEMSDFRKGCL